MKCQLSILAGIDMMIEDPLTKGLLSKIFIGHVERMDIIDKSLLA